MSYVTCYIELNEAYATELLEAAWQKTLPELTDVILASIRPYVKRDQGTLDDSPTEDNASLKQGKIKWNTPYARRQYWNYPAKTLTHHPLATVRWDEAAAAQCKDDWEKQAQVLFTEALGK